MLQVEWWTLLSKIHRLNMASIPICWLWMFPFSHKWLNNPYGDTSVIVYSPDHLDLDLPKKAWVKNYIARLVAQPQTSSFEYACHATFSLSLYNFAFSHIYNLNLSIWFNWMSLFSLATFKSKFKLLTAQYARCSNSTGKWQPFTKSNQ